MENIQNCIYDINDPDYPRIFPLKPYMNHIIAFAQSIQFKIRVDEVRFCVHLFQEDKDKFIKEITIQAFYERGQSPPKIGLFFIDVKRYKIFDNQISHKIIYRANSIPNNELQNILEKSYNEIDKL